MTAATASAAGAAGIVPAPAAGDQDKFLRGNATWATASDIINTLTTGSSDANANDYLVAQYAGGGTSTVTYHRRPVSKVVNSTVVKAALGTGSSTTTWLNNAGNWTTPTAANVGAITKLSSSTDNAVVRFDGTAGQVQNSSATLDDNGKLSTTTLAISGTTADKSSIFFGRTDGPSYINIPTDQYLLFAFGGTNNGTNSSLAVSKTKIYLKDKKRKLYLYKSNRKKDEEDYNTINNIINKHNNINQ